MRIQDHTLLSFFSCKHTNAILVDVMQKKKSRATSMLMNLLTKPDCTLGEQMLQDPVSIVNHR